MLILELDPSCLAISFLMMAFFSEWFLVSLLAACGNVTVAFCVVIFFFVECFGYGVFFCLTITTGWAFPSVWFVCVSSCVVVSFFPVACLILGEVYAVLASLLISLDLIIVVSWLMVAYFLADSFSVAISFSSWVLETWFAMVVVDWEIGIVTQLF